MVTSLALTWIRGDVTLPSIAQTIGIVPLLANFRAHFLDIRSFSLSHNIAVSAAAVIGYRQ